MKKLLFIVPLLLLLLVGCGGCMNDAPLAAPLVDSDSAFVDTLSFYQPVPSTSTQTDTASAYNVAGSHDKGIISWFSSKWDWFMATFSDSGNAKEWTDKNIHHIYMSGRNSLTWACIGCCLLCCLVYFLGCLIDADNISKTINDYLSYWRFRWHGLGIVSIFRAASVGLLCIMVLSRFSYFPSGDPSAFWDYSGGLIRSMMADVVYLFVTLFVFAASIVALTDLSLFGGFLPLHIFTFVIVLFSFPLHFVASIFFGADEFLWHLLFYTMVVTIVMSFISLVVRLGNPLVFIVYVPLYALSVYTSLTIVLRYIASWLLGQTTVLNVMTLLKEGFW